jgi:2-polyprenyl-6-methoxyphenol hydroxylase-like FAD-dependent oxidoreductase
LTVAIELARRGIAARVVDRAPVPVAGVRCPTLWPRTLEILAAMGLAVPDLLARGSRLRRKVFSIGGDVASVDLDTGGGLALLVAQAETEQALTSHLQALGGSVERGVTAQVSRPTGGDANRHWIEVDLDGPHGRERVRAEWLVLATGAAATDSLAGRIDYPGLVWVRADVTVEPDLDPGDEHIFRDAAGHAGLVPLGDRRHRLFLSLPGQDASPDTVTAQFERITGLAVQQLGAVWTHRPMSWVAARHVDGRVLRVGEAAVRFPMPVHGLNNGIQDGFNLGWKLATVVRRDASRPLLDSYQEERRSAALAALRRSEKVLGYGSSASLEVLRDRLRRGVFDVRGEPATRYDPGRLVVDRMPEAGDDLAPGAPVGPDRLCAARPLPAGATAGWTAAVVTGSAGVGGYDQMAEIVCALPGMAVRPAADPGAPPGIYLIRPDGHLGLRCRLDDTTGLRAYVAAAAGV